MAARSLVLAVLASCGHHAQLMTIDPNAQPLLDAWATALGGRDHIARDAVTHVHGTFVSRGATGTFESWVSARGELRSHFQFGATIDTTTIYDGTQGWTLDRDGRVLPLVANELEAAVRDAALGSYAPLLPDRARGTITRDGDAIVLTEGRHPLTITFDPVTHRPASYRSRSDVFQLGDWHEIDGVMIAFRTSAGGWSPTTDVVLDHVDHDSTSFAKPLAHPPPMTAQLPITLPFAVDKTGWGSVAVSINGSRPLTFIVDTGATHTTVNSTLLAELGLTPASSISTSGVGGSSLETTIPDVRLGLGPATIAHQTIESMDLSKVGRPVDGLLGGDVLSRFIVEFDYRAGTLRLLDHAPTGEAIPISIEEGLPMLDAAVELTPRARITGQFLLDTGCNCALSASASFADAHHVLSTIATTKPLEGTGAGSGAAPMVLAKIHALDVGGHRVANPVAAFSRETSGAMASPDFDGMVGAKLGQAMVITIEYASGRLWLR